MEQSPRQRLIDYGLGVATFFLAGTLLSWGSVGPWLGLGLFVTSLIFVYQTRRTLILIGYFCCIVSLLAFAGVVPLAFDDSGRTGTVIPWLSILSLLYLTYLGRKIYQANSPEQRVRLWYNIIFGGITVCLLNFAISIAALAWISYLDMARFR